jgi:hypothetical protein
MGIVPESPAMRVNTSSSQVRQKKPLAYAQQGIVSSLDLAPDENINQTWLSVLKTVASLGKAF